MRTLIVSMAAALFLSAPAMAGNGSTEPVIHDHEGRHKCIMFGAEKWQKLGLSDGQMNRVKEIQASCEADYKAAKEAGKDAEASVATHEQKLSSVLTPEHYTNWSQWCENKDHKEHKEGTKMEKPMQ